MMARWQKFAVFVGLISAVLLFGAVAQATTLTFDGDICGGGTSCSNGESIDQSYGDILGQLDVVYTHRVGNGNTVSDELFLKWWDTQYSNLTNVAYGGSNDLTGVSEIAFIPAAGYSVTVNAFDLGAWPQTARDTQATIYDSAYNELDSTGPITVQGNASSNISFGQTNANGLIIQWGPSAYNVGLDNLGFTVQTAAPVPEPSTVLLLASGLAGILGYGWRRKRAA
jgi:PEP-CTERM motif-containing protein